jgi:hypothetical protein
MNKYLVARTIFLMVIIALSGACKRYPDGETSGNRKMRIIKNWTLVKFYVNEVDATGGFVTFFNLFIEGKEKYRLGIDGSGLYVQRRGYMEFFRSQK